MSEDIEVALRMALKAVIGAAVGKGVDLTDLTETAINSMLDTLVYDSDDIAKAVIAIEVAADALPVD